MFLYSTNVVLVHNGTGMMSIYPFGMDNKQIDIECRKILNEIRLIKRNDKWARGKNLAMHQGLNNIRIYEKIILIRELRKLRNLS